MGPAAMKSVAGVGTVAIRAGELKVTGSEIQIDEERNGRREFKISSAPDLRAVAHQVAHLLRRTRATPADLKSGRVTFKAESVRQYLPAIPFNVAIGS